KLTAMEQQGGHLPEGYRYLPPTEAEWELACRAGSKTAYSFGDDSSRLGEFAVFGASRLGTYAHAVKSRKGNAWGFYDMLGNVWEWCADKVDYSSVVVSDAYSEAAQDPLGSSGPQRAARGGSWHNAAVGCRSANRYAFEPGASGGNIGFRPAL